MQENFCVGRKYGTCHGSHRKPLFCLMKSRERFKSWKRTEWMPMPPSLAEAFEAVERMPRYADSETPARTETRAVAPRTAQDGR
jgi:hypothetical protein